MNTFSQIYPDYQENWSFYFTTINDENCSIRTDLNLEEIAPVKDYPIRLTIMLEIEKFKEDASISENYEKANEIEDNLDKELSKLKYIKAGVITFMDQVHEIYYFRQNYDFESIVEPILKKYNVDYIIETREDKNWVMYLDFLSPDDYQRNLIYNRQILEEMKKHGDNAQLRRNIDFWVYSKKKEDAQKYIDRLKNLDLGFEKFEIIDSQDLEGKYIMLKFSRYMSLNSDQEIDINYITNLLVDISMDTNSYFDGWETTIASEYKDDSLEFEQFLENFEGPDYCVVSNRIFEDNMDIGYCYRIKPEGENDSGWTFFAGDEEQEYNLNSENFTICKLKDIYEYDNEVLAILNYPYGSAFEKDIDGKFIRVDFEEIQL